MADLAVVSGSVEKVYGGEATGIAGATITAGQGCYRNPADGFLYPARADTQVHANLIGVALNGASAGQTVTLLRGGLQPAQVNLGVQGAVGTAYFVAADTAGAFAPFADLVSGNWVSFALIALANECFLFQAVVSGVQHA